MMTTSGRTTKIRSNSFHKVSKHILHHLYPWATTELHRH